MHQPLCPTMVDIVVDLYQQFVKHCTDEDYVVSGHNPGGIVAFELVHYVLDHERDMPCTLFFSGCRPPDRASHKVVLHALPDRVFTKEIAELGRIPVGVFRNKESMTIFTPITRNDCRLCERYAFQAETRTLTCPIVLFHGNASNLAMQGKLPTWEKLTIRETRTIISPATDYFFIDKHFGQMIGYVNQTTELLEIMGQK